MKLTKQKQQPEPVPFKSIPNGGLFRCMEAAGTTWMKTMQEDCTFTDVVNVEDGEVGSMRDHDLVFPVEAEIIIKENN